MSQKGPILILDIDSSTLGACILELADSPTISHVQRIPVGTGQSFEPGAFIPALKEALTTLVPSYARLYPKLTSVAVVSASPWFEASVKGLTTKAEKPVKVNQASIKKMVDDFRQKNPAASGRTLLEALPITVEVNGYRTRVHNPVYGTSLSVTFYESFTDTSLYQMVLDTIHSSLAGATVEWHTTPLVYAETLLRISDEEHATVIDVGGEVTDIIILSHQRVAYVGSIPVGSRTIARAVAGKSGSLADSLSRLSMFARAELTSKEMQTISGVLTTAAQDWQKGYLSILGIAGNTVPLSHRVFVVGERDELPWLSQVVSGAELRGQRPVPTVVANDFFAGAVTYAEGGVFDSSLVLDALFFHMRDHAHATAFSSEPVLYSVQ